MIFNPQDFKILEKYVRKGAGSNIKTAVKPVKIMVYDKNIGSSFMRTYYAGAEKLEGYTGKASGIGKALVESRKVQGKYLMYHNTAKKVMEDVATEEKYKHALGTQWHSQHVFVSGAIGDLGQIAKRADLSDFEEIERSDDKVKSTHAVELGDRIRVKTEHYKQLNKDNSVTLRYENSLTTPGAKGKIENKTSSLRATAKMTAGGKRVLRIDSVNNYTEQQFGNYMTHMMQRFDEIKLDRTNKKIDKNIHDFANRLGFTAKASSEKHLKDMNEDFKNRFLPNIEKSINQLKGGLTDGQRKKVLDCAKGIEAKSLNGKNVAGQGKYREFVGIYTEAKGIKKPENMQEFTLNMLKNGLCGSQIFDSLAQRISNYYDKNNVKELTFHSGKGETFSTFSDHHLHSYMLGTDVNNDMHKGSVPAFETGSYHGKKYASFKYGSSAKELSEGDLNTESKIENRRQELKHGKIVVKRPSDSVLKKAEQQAEEKRKKQKAEKKKKKAIPKRKKITPKKKETSNS